MGICLPRKCCTESDSKNEEAEGLAGGRAHPHPMYPSFTPRRKSWACSWCQDVENRFLPLEDMLSTDEIPFQDQGKTEKAFLSSQGNYPAAALCISSYTHQEVSWSGFQFPFTCKLLEPGDSCPGDQLRWPQSSGTSDTRNPQRV